jgi:hypothetical protein
MKCRSCAMEALPGKTRCAPCQIKEREAAKHRRDLKKKDGVCVRCKLPAVTESYCDTHALEVRVRSKARTRVLTESRLCQRCRIPLEEDDKSKCRDCRDICNRMERELSKELKKQVIEHYGGSCRCCRESNLHFLTLDHIDGGGAKLRKEGKHPNGGINLYRWIIRHSFPDYLQVLCFNCNCGRSINRGICPHQDMPKD